MEPMWQQEGVDEYIVEGRTFRLTVKGFYNLMSPTCLIVKRSENGPLCHNVINASNQLVFISHHVLRNPGNL